MFYIVGDNKTKTDKDDFNLTAQYSTKITRFKFI